MIFQYLELLQTASWFFYLNLTLAGLIAGSFATTLIHRLPLMIERDLGADDSTRQPEQTGEGGTGAGLEGGTGAGLEGGTGAGLDEGRAARLSLSFPASHCPRCQTKIPYYLNLPIVGYILLRGRCAACGCRIDRYYPLSEAGCLILALAAGWYYGAELVLIPLLLLLWCLLVLSIIDLRSGLLPDLLTLGLLWAGLLLNQLLPFASLGGAVWGAAGFYIVLTLVNYCYFLLRRRTGIGGGDIKLFAALGAYFGWQSILPLLLLASCGGLILALFSHLFAGAGRAKLSRTSEQRWGPSIALAALVYLILVQGWPQLLAAISI